KPSFRGLDAKTIVFSRFQLPLPKKPGASVTICAEPPAASTTFSFPRAKNPSDRLSGDQNGACAPSVPGNGCAVVEASGRVQSCCRPSADTAMNARTRPSGDSASHGWPTGPPGAALVAPSETARVNVKGLDGAGAGRQNRPSAAMAATSPMSPPLNTRHQPAEAPADASLAARGAASALHFSSRITSLAA